MIIKCCELQIINFNHKLKLGAKESKASPYTKEAEEEKVEASTTSQPTEKKRKSQTKRS